MLRFVCFKWKNKEKEHRYREVYTAEHVNKFASMVSRHYKKPHEVICITDDPQGVEVKTIPIWNDLAEYGMCYRRLKVFSAEVGDLIGPKFVCMDIDCVILDDITDLFDDSPFKIFKPKETKTPYCGSMFMVEAGAKQYLWDNFNHKHIKWNGRRFIHQPAHKAGFVVGSDQAWISYNEYPNAKVWTKEDGVYNFRTDLYNKCGTEESRPQEAKIVFFAGKYDPAQKKLQETHPWIRRHWC